MKNETTYTAEKMKATVFTPNFVPAGFRHVREYAITHPNGKSCGALLQNVNTGIYVLHNAGTNESVPQEWARENADTEIRLARIAAGLSRAKMSRLFEIPIRTLENWESKVNIPPVWAEKLIVEKLHSMEEEQKNGKKV